MAFGTRYPLQVDTNATIPASTGSTPLNPTVLNQLRDAIIAVEQELGVKPSGTYTTVRMRLDTIEGLLNSIVSGTVTFGGDLSGTTTLQTVVGIQGRHISTATPLQGQALIYNGTDWIPSTNFFAQNITTTGILTTGPFYSTSSETGLFTLDGKIIINNIPTNSNLSNGGQAVIYYDQTSNKLKVSENGGAYKNLVPSSTSNVTWSNDLNGSTDLNQVVIALTGFNNITTIRSTSPTLQWVNTTLNPTITQDSSTGAGTTLSLLAQNAGGSNQAGGNLILGAGIQSGSGTPGYVSLKSGSTEIARVANNQFIALKGQRVNTTPVTTNYIVLVSDYIISVGTLSTPISVTLPASPTTGDSYIVKDTNGSSVAYNITINGNGNNIDGAASIVINQNYTSVTFAYTGSQWSIM